ncbi:DUF4412 domain-containing protein [Pedobacter sp. BS3]|uniref:DUF4412 domain-containing protein n=1 Tax=Pedobacter sp. BS3 TaxID=2567937 RepID=UPI0011ED9AD1|nr:DUF4412 domain-containing protein [Pedobacter sp. BS3]TZF82757.1 DUF4412 domain-containing protein [Pedobacter sp. BS3]
MRKIVLSLIYTCFACGTFAQTALNEGLITYQVEWQLPTQMQQMAGMFPTEMQVYFKGDSASTVAKSQMSSSVTLMNAKTGYQHLLLDIPMMSKKYSVNITPADREQMQDKWPEMNVKPTTETQTIAGYKAQKYQVTEKKSGQTFDAWFTKDISTPQNSLTQFFDASLGVPLKFNSFQNGLGIQATVKEIKSQKVPAGTFSVPGGYEDMSLEQLRGLMGRH